jgi:Holliday junction DNA helicase RuvA
VVELKDELLALARAAGPAKGRATGGILDQLAQALAGLGYKPAQAEEAAQALRDVVEGKTLDELLREALKRMRG